MQKITLYKIKRGKGATTVTPIKPEGEYTEMFRLIADEGKILEKVEKDKVITTPCVDVESREGWTEVELAPEELSDTEALKIIMGGVDE